MRENNSKLKVSCLVLRTLLTQWEIYQDWSSVQCSMHSSNRQFCKSDLAKYWADWLVCTWDILVLFFFFKVICKTWSKSCSKIARDVHQLREPGLIRWQAVQKVFLLSNLNIVLLIFYDAKITLNMYLHGITQTFQIHKLLLNCMMICVSFSLRFCVKRLPNSSMSAKVNIGSYCKFYVC